MLRKYLSLVVLLCSETVSASSSCCPTQVVGDKKYNFNSEMDTSSHNCKDNCVYKEDGSNNMVCFAAGNLEAVCEDSTSSTTSSGELWCWYILHRYLTFYYYYTIIPLLFWITLQLKVSDNCYKSKWFLVEVKIWFARSKCIMNLKLLKT